MSVTLNASAPSVRAASHVTIECGAHPIELEIGRIALQTTSTVCVKCNDTFIIVPLVAIEKSSDANFLPLSVHYHKRNYSDGHIPGARNRREGRPTDAEVLVSRLIDRPLRAVFPKKFYHEVQVSPMVVSSDPNIKSDILAMLGASAALALSGLPCRGPVASVRVGYIDEKFVINPTHTEMEQSLLDVVIAGTESGILMVEAEAKALKKETIIEAILFGQKEIQKIARQIQAFSKQFGRPRWQWEAPLVDAELEKKVSEVMHEELAALYQLKSKSERKAKREAFKERMIKECANEEKGITASQLESLVDTLENKYMKHAVLSTKRRLDGRDPKTIRPIQIEVGVLPRVHGSALFTRGDTQALVSATLGSDRDAEITDGLDGITRREAFMLHYNFPPYCVGEVGQMGSPKRREIGHGNLAKRAMRAVLPNERECPYVLRVVSEVMESNGSSSMATVCGASLALMDAGVPLKSEVAGIAMGLLIEGNKFVVLSDISAEEDHLGDMDLKVAGTREGITALQMDIKTDGITPEILSAAIEQAEEGLHHILDKMKIAISQPRQQVSQYAPQVRETTIPVEKIQALIGKGGTTIRSITEETGTLIDIHRETGVIRISGPDVQACDQALQRVKGVTDMGPEVEIGALYEGVVVKLLQAGAIVSILPGRKGFVHISQALLDYPEQSISDLLKEKQRIMVKVLDIDRQANKIKLTMKGFEKETIEPSEAASE